MWYQKAKQPFQVRRPKWSLSAIRYLAIILLAKCGKSSPSQMNSRPIYQEMLNAVWLLEHSISYKTQFSSGSLAFHHYFATFCIFFLSLLIGMVCQACSYWALDQHSSQERGGNWGRNWEGCLCWVCLQCCLSGTWSWLSPQAPSLGETGVTELGQVCTLLLEPLGSEEPPLPNTTHVHRNTWLTLSQGSYVCASLKGRQSTSVLL